MENRIFCDCIHLKSIVIPDSVTELGDWVFLGCKSLKTLTIPNHVTVIGKAAFADCSSLTELTIPDSVTGLGDFLFINCAHLIRITIPSNVKNIMPNMFDSCPSLKEIIVNGKDTYISFDGVLFKKTKVGLNLIFYPASKKEKAYIIPKNVTSIINYAFIHCQYLTSVTIPDNIVSIEKYAFYDCNDDLTIFYSSPMSLIKSKKSIKKPSA